MVLPRQVTEAVWRRQLCISDLCTVIGLASQVHLALAALSARKLAVRSITLSGNREKQEGRYQKRHFSAQPSLPRLFTAILPVVILDASPACCWHARGYAITHRPASSFVAHTPRHPVVDEIVLGTCSRVDGPEAGVVKGDRFLLILPHRQLILTTSD